MNANTATAIDALRVDTLDPSRVATQFVITPPSRGVAIRVDPDDFRACLLAAGSSLVEHVKEPPKPHTALTRAVRRAKQGLKDADGERGMRLLWRRVGTDSSGVLSYALAVTTTDAEHRAWEGKQVCSVAVGKTGGDIHIDWAADAPTSGPIVDEVAAVETRYRRVRGVLTQPDIRDFVNAAMKQLRGQRLGGTVSFVVAKDDDDEVMRLVSALALARVDVLANEISEFSKERFAAPVQASLVGEIEALSRAIEEMQRQQRGETKNGQRRKFRESTWEERFNEVQRIRDVATTYKMVLGMATETIDEQLQEAERLITRVVMEGVDLDNQPLDDEDED